MFNTSLFDASLSLSLSLCQNRFPNPPPPKGGVNEFKKMSVLNTRQ